MWFQKSFSKTQTATETKIDNNQILVDHLEGISYRDLESRHPLKKNKLCKTVNEKLAGLKNNFEITKFFLNQLSYTGNLIVDGKFVPVKEVVDVSAVVEKIIGKIPRSKKRQKVIRGKVLIWGADYWTHDIPHFEFGNSESEFIFSQYFKKLKEINYPLKSLTVDDKKEIVSAVKTYYPKVIIQLCIRHYLAKINKELSIGNVKRKIRALENRIDKLFPEKDSDRIPATCKLSIRQIVKLYNELSDLEHQYELLLDFQYIIVSIICASNYQTALYRIESLEKYFWPRRFEMREQFPTEQIKLIKKLFTDFFEHKEYLLNYLKYPHLNIPSTTNLMEGNNSQIENRLNSIKGFESEQTANNYVNAWIVKRRFKKFTDCKKHFKKLNGKTPLECAGADISKIDNWINWSSK